mmetsp:Transcript_88366/g.250413  ORF Transcript_88366/g.250413 Transcript_88366/m.250413 type:complete len:215 (+) Transcript_88366:108-752(+)
MSKPALLPGTGSLEGRISTAYTSPAFADASATSTVLLPSGAASTPCSLAGPVTDTSKPLLATSGGTYSRVGAVAFGSITSAVQCSLPECGLYSRLRSAPETARGRPRLSNNFLSALSRKSGSPALPCHMLQPPPCSFQTQNVELVRCLSCCSVMLPIRSTRAPPNSVTSTLARIFVASRHAVSSDSEYPVTSGSPCTCRVNEKVYSCGANTMFV